MTTDNYKAILSAAIDTFRELSRQRTALDAEMSKLWQFIWATTNMLSDQDRNQCLPMITELAKEYEVVNQGLTEAIRGVLEKAPTEWFSVVKVRDKLNALGFDFSQYTSNEMASISTVLKRLTPREVETKIADGLSVYRWIKRFPRTHAARVRSFAGSGSIANIGRNYAPGLGGLPDKKE
jgi:hypothetical protein